MTITLRSEKGAPLSHSELDGNFEHLRDEKANTGHEHTESDITDLDKYTQDEVDDIADGKSDTDHTHTESEITDLDKYTQDEVDSLVDGKLSDAPEDGKQYARKDGDWTEVEGGTSPSNIDADTIDFNEEYDNGSVSSDTEIDWSNGNNQVVTLEANVELTFSNMGVGHKQLRILQDDSGGHSVTLPSARWPEGQVEDLTQDADAEDILSIFYNGTNYYFMMSKNWS